VTDKEPAAPLTFTKLKTKRTFEEVVARVREMLFGGALKPGDRLPGERDLAAQLGIGRPALREALRALESSGLIVLRKGKTGGAFISNGKPSVIAENMSDLLRLSSISVDQFYEVRLWIQTGLARAACKRATKSDIERLRQNVFEGERLHKQGLDLKRIEVNVEFHNILAEATKNQVAQIVIRGLTDALKVLSQEMGSYPIASLFKDRLSLVEALEKRDEDAAATAMEKILKSTMMMYKRLEAKRLVARQPSQPPAVRKSANPTSKRLRGAGRQQDRAPGT
jgi:GntR family transcriptional regulator, transcriptional repressor for pyruvate dehydrogenase complex